MPNSETSSPIPVKPGLITVTDPEAYLEEGHATVSITFSDGTNLTADYWRLIKDGKSVLSSFDHRQQYGLPAPINAIEQIIEELDKQNLVELQLDKTTGDLTLKFSEAKILQIFNFTGYESWVIRYTDGRMILSNYVLSDLKY
jgi:hypothetical protein